MRVTSFKPTQDSLQAIGLKDVSFERLGRLIVLAGPNGSGKSRILRLLRDVLGEAPLRLERRAELNGTVDRMSTLLRQRQGDPQSVNWERKLRSALFALERLNSITLESEARAVRVADYVPYQLQMTDPISLNRAQMREHLESARQPGIDAVSSRALAYIQGLQDRYWHVTHQGFVGEVDERQTAINSYESLRSTVQALLGTTLERSGDDATLFGTPIGQTPFSNGQRVLLQMAVAIHPVHDDESLILAMDEPENHLHPSALIAVLDRVTNAFPRSQIWMATHSVPLISHLYAQDPSCLYFVESGTVSFAGRKPGIVLAGLLGSESEQAKLLSFIDLPSVLAAVQFAAECLLPPTVAEHQSKDSQLDQMGQLIETAFPLSAPRRVLDVGAGRGRLLGGLADRNDHVPSHVDYVAFDISTAHHEVCTQQIEKIYGSATRRCYSDGDKMFVEHGINSFDIAVMCNVLHEIDPSEWGNLFGPNGMITNALKDDGYLLLVEDLRIPVGELPHSKGFFLLDTLHLQKLFGASITEAQADAIKVSDMRGDGRLKAHLIPKKLVERMTKESRREAIESLRDTSARKLRELRELTSTNYQAGLANGLWSQQFASCYMFLQQ